MAQITLETSGGRTYFLGDTYSVRQEIRDLGGHWDGDRRAWWVGSIKESEAQALVARLNAAPAERKSDDPDGIRLTGKGQYKGRSYFLGSYSRDGRKVRCLTLPDAQGKFLDFWAEASLVQVIKEYRPREYRGRMEFTTLGSIARFVERESRNRDAGGPVCAACGRSGDLVEDMEDGLPKHRGCCDIEP